MSILPQDYDLKEALKKQAFRELYTIQLLIQIRNDLEVIKQCLQKIANTP